MTNMRVVFNHLVLPPHVPGKQDANVQHVNDDILTRLIHATATLSKLAGQGETSSWHAVRQSLSRCEYIHALGRLERRSLISELQRLEHDQPLILYVVEQNAALFVRRSVSKTADVVIFEAFETSPPSTDVLASRHALIWDFPDCAAQIPTVDFQKVSFQEALADFLEKGSMEPLKLFQPHIVKAQISVVESRDTCSPALVTHLLIPLLESIGCSGDKDAPRLRKRVRDDVNIDVAELPWRRLPFWLVLRVCTQRQLQLSLGNQIGRVHYKFLIAVLLMELLNDCSGVLAPEMTILLRGKICRRLAKLEQNTSESPAAYDHLFTITSTFLKEGLILSTKLVESAWEKYKRATTRPIPRLPSVADPQAQHLTLPNSGTCLQDILNLPRAHKKTQPSLRLPVSHDGMIEQVEKFTDMFFRLADLESKIITKAVPQLASISSLTEAIFDQFEIVGTAYDADPGQMSVFILSIFTLWMRLDKYMAEECSLLLQYHPVFTPQLLDTLHLSTVPEMKQLLKVQTYLQKRCKECKYQTTIFSKADEKSFAVAYATKSKRMQILLGQIEEASEASKAAKKAELDRWSQTYDEHSLSIAGGTCTCTFMRDGNRNVRGCSKCWHWRTRNRMEIFAHEDFLPKGTVAAAAIVFELGISQSLAMYRNATWKIFGLAYPAKPATRSPMKLLKDYEPLQAYGRHSTTGITIASTSKSFRGTHYKVAKKKMKASESDVLYPNGLTFLYFDSRSSTFIENYDKPLTFQHLCGVHVPLGLQISVMQQIVHPPPELHRPSSYEIVASETRCPSDMSINEFTVYQRLLSGDTRRWLTMLMELGASDVNFSSEDTMHMFNHLATQAGPALENTDYFRDAYGVFKDPSFCTQLAVQIGGRLRSIMSNWREVHCMEVMVTLSLRLFDLSSSKTSAEALLKEARNITLQWISRLRINVRSSTESSAAESAARYAFFAALLCRRTFSHLTASSPTIPPDDLTIFIQGSLALQENLLVDLDRLSPTLKNMLVRDTKMTHKLQSLLLRSIKGFPHTIGMAINTSWSEVDSSSGKAFADWQNVPHTHDRWVVSTMTASVGISTNPQVVHYNFIEGHLLVDGKPLGRLPRDMRESSEVKQIFGNYYLLAFPSAEFGMSYVLATSMKDHEIHLGTRNGRTIIRARRRKDLLEYIPSSLFTGSDSIDLPYGLISDCMHWLNLNTKCIEVRRKLTKWKTRTNDWIIDLVNRQGRRSGHTSLIDPNSDLSKEITGIFRHFENSRKITIFQPANAKGKLSVELRHLELSFFVNQKGLLECRELREEIDPDQDAGTLYGFDSKIVLRNVANRGRRSIIAPWGKISTKRRGMHVAVRAAGSDEYARFEIDDILGRLSCPSEPRLLYAKAQFHAFTSFVIPDPLTGHTGTEEAIESLQSGYSQPWVPLGERPVSILKTIADISPVREYYPKDKRNLQKVFWNADLTTTIQHEAYEGIVQSIIDKSERLRVFTPNVEGDTQISLYIPSHLRQRGAAQRCLYDRSIRDAPEESTDQKIYKSRGQQANSKQASKVYQISNVLRAQPFRLHTARTMSMMLQDWPLIGGFHNTSDFVFASLSDLTAKNIDEQWGSLVNACRNSDPKEPYSLMFRLSLMSLNSSIDMDAIKIFAAFASVPALRALQTPSGSSFNGFKLNECPTSQSLFRVISVDLPKMSNWKTSKALKAHSNECEDDAKRLALHLSTQWPCEEVTLDGFKSDLIDTGLAMDRVVPEWHRLQANSALLDYVIQVQTILEQYKGPSTDVSTPKAWDWTGVSFSVSTPERVVLSCSKDLLVKSVASQLDNSSHKLQEFGAISNHGTSSIEDSNTKTKETVELRKILNAFSSTPNPLRQQYSRDIEASLDRLEHIESQSKVPHFPSPNITTVERHIHELRTTMKAQLVGLRNALSFNDNRFQWLELGRLWPCNTSVEILKQLRSTLSCDFGHGVKEAIVSHGILITDLQRLLRIRNALYQGKITGLQEDLGNRGHENWDPLEWPDWLLLEIDSNILIRQEQIDVAQAIIAPSSCSNTVLQLNMGKGKTSCIVPMAMAVLGNGTQLSRLIVPKPLLLPTAQMIQSRLGGLVGREIRHLPFSRRTNLNSVTLQLYEDLHQEILLGRGVVLNSPEHILSFRLSGLQSLVNESRFARKMLDFQSWLDTTSRDVLDESDVSLAVKTQLIYPSGKQIAVDGHPHRWQVTQSLLELVKDHLPELQRKFPQSIEVIERSQGYPMVYILKTDVEEDLHRRIVEEVCTGRTSFLRFANITSTTAYGDIQKVLLDTDLDKKYLKRVSALFADRSIASKTLLLVRGLLRNRILLLCLKKRWNVQYGLHPSRDPIAVPFEAKGVPSEQAEFGHPDAAILFTCLAFYYSGLNQTQFNTALRHILGSHDPSSEYDRWTSGCDTLPEALYHWNVINVDDQGQAEELWKHLRTTRSVLNHYMNHFVFPAHAKQFGVKLQASGWDLPLFSTMETSNSTYDMARTTGFSGTNDNKMMLPLTIKQGDLSSLQHTNAEVLTYLLQARNRSYQLAACGGKRLSETGLLEKLKEKNIRILIDAGAYILEMDNEALAKAWLDVHPGPQAAVFYGSDNRAWVLYRGMKAKVPLLATPFVDNLDNCLVYLDEAHTRGVDLKLPQNACGALTLALGQTKDHTVQAAMRLRQLATTQSLCFFAFPETNQSILDVCGLKETTSLDSSHVVYWLLEQTCRANEQLQNLFVSQGIDFCNRKTAEFESPAFILDPQDRDAFTKVIQHPEQQTLEQLYGGRAYADQRPTSPKATFPKIQSFLQELDSLRHAVANDPNAPSCSALEEVEQEREVEFQIEEVREVQRPTHYESLKFPGLHCAIIYFVQTGVLLGEAGYEHVFTAISRTSVGQKFSDMSIESRIFVSAEFMRTIETGTHGSTDNFLRPVEWVLYSPGTSTALVIIAEEAELLISKLRALADNAKVHLLLYAAPVTKKMLHFSRLKYYALPSLPLGHVVPQRLINELGIFAGRLYMEFDECATLVKFIDDACKSKRPDIPTAKTTNLLFEWLCLRRRGQDIMHTPVGYVCQGRPLDRGHAFFATHHVARTVDDIAVVTGTNGGKERDEDEDEDENEEDEVNDDVKWDGVK